MRCDFVGIGSISAVLGPREPGDLMETVARLHDHRESRHPPRRRIAIIIAQEVSRAEVGPCATDKCTLDPEGRPPGIIARPVANDPAPVVECSAPWAIDHRGRRDQLDQSKPSRPGLICHLQRGLGVWLGLFGGLDEDPVQRSPALGPTEPVDSEASGLALKLDQRSLGPATEYPVEIVGLIISRSL